MLKRGETKVDYARRTVDKEAAFAEPLLRSRFEQDRLEEVTTMRQECRALVSELKACREDQKRLIKEGKETSNQNATAPSQPKPTWDDWGEPGPLLLHPNSEQLSREFGKAFTPTSPAPSARAPRSS
jgi:hypothetical protein